MSDKRIVLRQAEYVYPEKSLSTYLYPQALKTSKLNQYNEQRTTCYKEANNTNIARV